MRIVDYLGSKNDFKNIVFDFSFLTKNIVSCNEMYGISNGKIYKTKKALEFQNSIIAQIQESIIKSLKHFEIYKSFLDNLLCYEIYVGMYRNKNGWVLKNGRLKKIDLENIMKVIDDAIIVSLNIDNLKFIDDSLCVGQILEKLINEDLDNNQNVFKCTVKLYLKK